MKISLDQIDFQDFSTIAFNRLPDIYSMMIDEGGMILPI